MALIGPPMQGFLLRCDVPTKEFVVRLDELQPPDQKIIVQFSDDREPATGILDETHLFIRKDMLDWVQAKLDEHQQEITFTKH